MLEIHLHWWMLPPAIWTAFCLCLAWLDSRMGEEFRGGSAVFFIICAVIGLALMLATRFLP